jgi:hypothetical protein
MSDRAAGQFIHSAFHPAPGHAEPRPRRNDAIGGQHKYQNERTEILNQPAEEPLPENVRRLIVERINSVEALEILLLLFAQPTLELSAAEVSRKLYTTLESASTRLAELQRVKLLVLIGTEPPKYRFNSQGPESALVAELEKTYRQRRVSVISFIYTKPSDPLRAFSDAFRLRKDEP